MPHIVVSPLSQLVAQIEQHRPSHIVTLASADVPSLPVAAKRLSLTFNDITEPRDGLVLPNQTHIEQLLDFAAGWDRTQPLLIHCYAGISRSTASAYIVALALNPDRKETELAQELRLLSSSATPNMRLIELADRILDRRGRMVTAIREIGRGAEAFEGETFSLPVAD